MIKKKNKKENTLVTEWQGRIKKGEEYMKKYSRSEHFDKYRKYYRGDWLQSIVPVNRVFSFGRGLIPQTYFNNPRVCVTATRPDMVAHAMVVEAVDNYLIQELKLKKVLKMAILRAYLAGTAPIKLGYDSEYGYLPMQAVDTDSGTVTQVGRSGSEEGLAIEYDVNIRPGMPWAKCVNVEDIIIPWGYSDPDDLPWIAHKILRPIEDIKADQKYQNTKDLKGTRIADTKKSRSAFHRDKDTMYGELYEIRDMKTKKVLVICEDTLLLHEDDSLNVNGFNYAFLTFNEDPEHFWGIPDVAILEPQQLELNDTRTQASKHRKIALIKFLYLKGAITDDELDALLSNEVGPAVGIDGESISNAIMQLTPHIPPDLRGEAMNILSDMQLSMGFSENAVGNFKGGTPPSAAETVSVGNVQEMRIEERKDLVRDLLIDIVRKWNQYIFSFWDGTRVAKIVGPEGTEMWVEYAGMELAGEYNMRIDPDSGQPVSRNMKQQLMDGVMKTYGGDPMIDQMLLRRMHLGNYEWVSPNITSLLKPPPPPMDPAMAGNMRQPTPQGGGSSGPAVAGQSRPGGQRGGGMPVSSPQNPIPFEKFKERITGGR